MRRSALTFLLLLLAVAPAFSHDLGAKQYQLNEVTEPLTGEQPSVDPQTSASPMIPFNPADANWDSRFWRPGMSGAIQCMAEFHGELYVGGQFRFADDVSLNYVAKYSPLEWLPVGGGLPSYVTALIVYQDHLWAACSPGLYRFSGGDWQCMSTAIIDAIIIHNDSLVAASGDYLKFWNGSALQNMPNPSYLVGFTNALASFQGDIYRGGYFYSYQTLYTDNLARRTGGIWGAVGHGLSTESSESGFDVNLLKAVGDSLFVAGSFTRVDGVPSRNFACWNGWGWHPLPIDASWHGYIHDVVRYNNELFVACDFRTDQGNVHFAKLTPEGLQPVAEPTPFGANKAIVFDSKLFVGGASYASGGYQSGSFNRFDGTSWYPGPPSKTSGVGLDNAVFFLMPYDDKLLAGGMFTQAGDRSVSRLALWDGNHWTPFSQDTISSYVYSAIMFNGELVLAGYIPRINSQSVRHIVRWNGSAFEPLTSSITAWPMRNSPDWIANSNAECLYVYQDKLYVGGYFGNIDGVPNTRYVSTWDGSSWSALGDGLDSSVNVNGTFSSYAAVYDMTEHNGDLILAGEFQSPLPDHPVHLARWDGTTLHPMLTSINGHIHTIASYKGELYIGGHFTQINGQAINRVARWDGTSWHDLGNTNSGAFMSVSCLKVIDDMLFVSATEPIVPSQNIGNCALWNGSSWIPLGSGIDNWAYAIEKFGDQWIIGGSFRAAGGKYSARVAAWTPGNCCYGESGNINMLGTVDLADLSQLISYLTVPLPKKPGLICADAANVNGSGIVDLADLSLMIAYLTVGGPSRPFLAPCP